MNVFEAFHSNYLLLRKITNYNKIINTFQRTITVSRVTFTQNQLETDTGSDSELNQKVKKPRKKSNSLVLSKFITPKLAICHHNFNNVTSVILDSNSASWATINRTTNSLSDWKYCDLDLLSCKLKSNTTYEIIPKIFNELPKSDIYIFEEFQISKFLKIKSNLPLLLLNFGLMQLTAMLTTMLNVQDNEIGQPKVYYLKTNVAAKMFKCVLNGEKLSLRKKVQEILENHKNEILLKSIPKIPVISSDFQTYFLKEKDIRQELLSQALVLSIAFVELYSNENK